MSTIIINECKEHCPANDYMLDLRDLSVNDCIGCWSCWWKIPGRCISDDLNTFYHRYIKADKAIFFAKVKKGFVSGNMKALFDRMIPLFLPYVTYKTGESMHVPRYDHYPDIEFYYDGEFETENGQKIFEDYIHRVFYQFYSKNIVVKPIADYREVEGVE